MTNLDLPDSLVDIAWLQQHLEHPQLVVFDASYHMPGTGRDAADEWREAHIPGARFFDFDGSICDSQSSLPHMLPDAESFTREMRSLGLNTESRVVAYDAMGMFSSPRAWWMLSVMGHANVALLDGGLPAWKAAGYPLQSAAQTPTYPAGNFSAQLDVARVADAGTVLAALDDAAACVLDARPTGRFSGAAEEPRAGLRRGHMPGALNLPFAELFEAGLLKSDAELAGIVKPLLGEHDRVICSCGSGVTACILAFALQRVGVERVAVYDGSWCEWGLPGELPVIAEV